MADVPPGTEPQLPETESSVNEVEQEIIGDSTWWEPWQHRWTKQWSKKRNKTEEKKATQKSINDAVDSNFKVMAENPFKPRDKKMFEFPRIDAQLLRNKLHEILYKINDTITSHKNLVEKYNTLVKSHNILREDHDALRAEFDESQVYWTGVKHNHEEFMIDLRDKYNSHTHDHSHTHEYGNQGNETEAAGEGGHTTDTTSHPKGN